MSTRNNELAKNTVFLLVGNIGSKVLAFILIPIYTNILSTSEYGIYDVLTTTESLLIPIITVGISDAVFRYTIDRNYDAKSVFVNGIRIWLLGIAFCFVLCSLCIHIIDIQYCMFVFCAFLFHSLYSILINYAKGVERISLISVGGVINTFVFGISSVFSLIVLKIGLVGYMMSYVISYIIPNIYLFIGLKSYISVDFKLINSELLKKMLSYSIPLVLAGISWWIISASDRYMVMWLCGAAKNGIYSMGYKIPNIMVAFMSVFSQAWVVSAIKENDILYFKKVYRLYFAGLSLLSLIIIVLSELLGRILYAKDFFEAWKVAPILLVAAVFQGLTGFLCDLLTTKKDAIGIGLASTLGALWNIICNLILISFWGIYGASIATLISYFVVWGFLCWRLYKKYSIELVGYKDFLQLIILILTTIFAVKRYQIKYALGVVFIALIILLNFKNKEILILKKRKRDIDEGNNNC